VRLRHHRRISTPGKAFPGGGGGSITAYRDAVVADSPVAYYRLAESVGPTAADSAGTFTGTYVNTPTLGVTSPISDTGDKAVTFAAASSQCVTAASVSSAINNFAVEAWMQLPSLTGQLAVVAFNGDDQAAGGGWGFGLSNGAGSGTGVRLTVYLGSITALDGLYAFADTNWHHVVMTRESGTIKCYVDGVSTGAAIGTAPVAGTAAMRIGCQRRSTAGDYRFFNGSVDEVSFYNTAITSTRAAAHYAAR
jgi:hypothetical protein